MARYTAEDELLPGTNGVRNTGSTGGSPRSPLSFCFRFASYAAISLSYSIFFPSYSRRISSFSGLASCRQKLRSPFDEPALAKSMLYRGAYTFLPSYSP